jgi:RNA polymerase sigma-70 factor (ECF subfamily)
VLERHRAAREGDLRAFELLVHRHEGHVRANCGFISGNAEEARDLAQEVFVKAYFALQTFRGESAFRTWLRRIKVNHCLNHVAKRGSGAEVPLSEALEVSNPAFWVEAEETLDEQQLEVDVAAVLLTLPDTLRVPLVLHDMDDFTHPEVASALGIGLSAVKMRVNRGRAQFREEWTRRFGSRPR